MTVHPLSYAHGGQDGSAQDGTAGDPSESVLFRPTGKGHPNGAPEGVARDLTSAGTVLRVDWEHWSRFVWYALVYRVISAIQGQSVPAPKVAHALGVGVF